MGKASADSGKARQDDEAPEGRLSGTTLDAGALIALDRNDRRVMAVLESACEESTMPIVPATALAYRPGLCSTHG